jgi:ABC-type microcin C transport system duplicated ATPase subunit YejF
MALVEVNQLQVTFGENRGIPPALLLRKETFSLIGESGCGKSTICACWRVYNVSGAATLPCWASALSQAAFEGHFAATCRWCFRIRGRRCTQPHHCAPCQSR